MAEAHPVGFQWVMEAKARGATVIHVDPRFSRTSAMADRHVPIRAGSDIAFLGGIINHVLREEKYFREYVLAYTNASTILSEDFVDTEDLDGVFSGLDREHRTYDFDAWRYQAGDVGAAAGYRDRRGTEARQRAAPAGPRGGPRRSARFRRRGRASGSRHRRDAAASPVRVPGPEAALLPVHPGDGRADLRHLAGELPCRVRRRHQQFRPRPDHRARVQRRLDPALGRGAVHPHRRDPADAARQHGRPGGGILALRGHASIQGSTDIPTLFDLLPGYLPMPHAHGNEDLDAYVDAESMDNGFWASMRSYLVSLLKAWWGAAATPENDFCYGYLPRLTGSHGTYETVLAQLAGECSGYFLFGENPAVGSANGRMQRMGMAKLDWLVVRDFSLIESATWWKDGPEIETGEMSTEDIGTEVFFLPAAAHTEKSGSFTNTQRMLQWHHEAVEPAGDARSDLWFAYHLGRKIRERLAGAAGRARARTR